MKRNLVAGVVLAFAGAVGISLWVNLKSDNSVPTGGRLPPNPSLNRDVKQLSFPAAPVPPSVVSSGVSPVSENVCDSSSAKTYVAAINDAGKNMNAAQSEFERFLKEIATVQAITKLESNNLSQCFSNTSQYKAALTSSARSNAIVAIRERTDVLRQNGPIDERFKLLEEIDRVLNFIGKDLKGGISEEDILRSSGYDNPTYTPEDQYGRERYSQLYAISETAIERMKQRYGYDSRESRFLTIDDKKESAKSDPDLRNTYTYLDYALRSGVLVTGTRVSLLKQLHNFFRSAPQPAPGEALQKPGPS